MAATARINPDGSTLLIRSDGSILALTAEESHVIAMLHSAGAAAERAARDHLAQHGLLGTAHAKVN